MKSKHISKTILPAAVLVLAAGVAATQVPQFGGGRGRGYGGGSGPIYRTEGGQSVNIDTVRTARETLPMVTEFANWTNAPGFGHDAFPYARIIFESYGWHDARGWVNDYPDADLNFSFRLQELTSLKTDPDGRVIKLTDPKLLDYPLVFASQPGQMALTEEEVGRLRQYLRNGGVLVGDDMWGTAEWEHFAAQMQRILPESQWTELTMSHPLFHSVFDFKGAMSSLQVPSIHFWQRNRDANFGGGRVSRGRGPGSEDMHVRAWLDQRQRIVVVGLLNTDTGDGFEREGEEEEYFHLFSETRAYPLGINLVYYVMTH